MTIVPFPRSEDGDVSDLIRIALLGLPFHQLGLFAAPADKLEEAWLDWRTNTWPEWEAGIDRVYQAAEQGKLEDVLAEDGRLERLLATEEIRTRNKKLVALIAASMEGAKQQRALHRFRDMVESGQTPGLAPVFFALRAAHYHTGAWAAKAAYLYREWRASREASAYPLASLTWEVFRERHPLPSWGSSAESPGPLRVFTAQKA